MLNKITIEFDVEKKQIHKVEGTKDINPLDIAKILMSVSLTSLNKLNLKPESKIIKPKVKII